MDSKVPLSDVVDSRETVENLNTEIDYYHDLIISEDGIEKKNDAWNCLQESARKYLCLVPQNRKFKFNETERVLNQSANSREDFDPREACQAFECLAKYAYNLLKQPWRQEFHTIQLTSGFYVHNVAAHLKNAQEILIAMGYVNISDKSLKLVPNYELSTIKAVSRDCVLACQECLILSHIWEKVSFEEPNHPFTTDQVYEFRSRHKGDVEESCKIFLDEVRAKSVSKGHKENRNTSSFMNFTNDNRSLRSSKNVNETSSYSRMESDEHFYDAVSPGKVSNILFSPTTRRSKSMTFSTSTPKRMSSTNEKSNSDKFFSAEITFSEDMLDQSLSPKAASEVGRVYSNVPSSHRDKNNSKSLLNREKTKWHTPMKYKLQPQGHLKFSKLNERELSYLMKESDADDLRMDFRKIGNINQRADKKIEIYDSTSFPRVRDAPKNAPNENANYDGRNRIVHVDEVDGSAASSMKSLSSNETSIPKLKRSPRGNMSKPATITSAAAETKSSNSESSYLNDDVGCNYKKYGSEASSTDASSWDLKLKMEEERKNVSGDHFYDVPEASESPPAKISIRKDPCSRSSFGLCQKDDTTAYYDDPNESIGFGFALGSPRNLNQSQKFGRDNNTTFFTCDDSFKSLVGLDQSSTSNVKKDAKLDDLEDVWFHTLLKKEGGFNYLDTKYEEPMSEFESYPEQVQSEPVKSKSKYSGKYFPSETETLRPPYSHQTESFDRRLDKGSDMVDYSIFNKSSTSGKLDDSIIKANLQKKFSKTNQTSKATIDSLNSRPKGAEGGIGIGRHLPSSSGKNILPFDSWDCKHCTFINCTNEYICEICSKTKDYSEDQHDVIEGVESLLPKLYSLPEYIKGDHILDEEPIKPTPGVSRKTCPQCTLINVSAARICEACGFRLKEFNSPSKTTWLEDMFEAQN